jgi:DNA-binding response OmpR family regulator
MCREETLKKGNILVVEDNVDNLRMLKIILEEEGYSVRPTTNGTIALSAAKAIPPDLVLLDITLPDIDGFEICRALKKTPNTKDVPIIFLTGKTSTDEMLRGFQVGGADYITKPFSNEVVLARISTHLQLRKMHVELIDKNKNLELAMASIKNLEGLIPICASCKNVRDDKGYWEQVESYMTKHADITFSHSICPECMARLYPDFS